VEDNVSSVAFANPVPALLRLPLGVLLVCTCSGFLNILTDQSLLVTVEEEIQSAEPKTFVDWENDPRCRAASVEEFGILSEEKVE